MSVLLSGDDDDAEADAEAEADADAESVSQSISYLDRGFADHSKSISVPFHVVSLFLSILKSHCGS